MKRSELQRKTPMKRGGWDRNPGRQDAIEDRPAPAPSSRKIEAPRARMAVFTDTIKQIPKEEPVRSEAYRRLVAALPCMVCGISGHSQAAHPNTGKGMGTKTDDRLCFPLCADRLGTQGCHPRFDQHAMFTREQRQALEPAWAKQTQDRIIAAGQWPESLPRL